MVRAGKSVAIVLSSDWRKEYELETGVKTVLGKQSMTLSPAEPEFGRLTYHVYFSDGGLKSIVPDRQNLKPIFRELQLLAHSTLHLFFE